MLTALLAGLLTAMDLNAQLDALLKELQPRSSTPVGWSWRLTPAVPAKWPATGATTAVRYAYAAGFDPALRDGERQSAPFAMVELAPDGGAKLTALTKHLEDLQVQGVRPITREEAALQSGDLIEAAKQGQLETLRATWCAWRKTHGVASRHVEVRHPDFFKALACDQAK